MADGRSDDRLVTEHLAGDRQALAAIYDRYADALYDTAAAMLRDRDEAADAVQDVFVIAAAKLEQLADRTRLRPWLFAVLRNGVYRRTAKRRRSVPTDFSTGGAEMADPSVAIEAGDVERDALAAMVRDAAAGLDPRDQLVLELSARQSLSGHDLADALGVSVSQSYVLVSRMRDRVERSIGALTIARMGRRDCPDLAGLLAGWDGTFSVLVRKRVARHIERCDTCERSRRRYAVVPLVATAPVLAAPAGLRDRVLGAAQRASSAEAVHLSPTTGFPALHRTWRRFAVAAGVVAAALVGIGAVAVVAGDEPATTTVAPPSGPAPVTTAAPTSAGPATATSTSTTSTSSTTTSTTVPPTAPPAPGVITVSAATVQFGQNTTSGEVVVGNGGGSPMTVTVAGSSAPYTWSFAPGPLAPGETRPLRATLDRTGLAEGDVRRTIVLQADGVSPVEVQLRGRVEHDPVVAVIRSAANLPCPGSARQVVTVSVEDESPISSVVLAWQGSGRPGQVAMTERGGAWIGDLGLPRLNGTYVLTITATDSRGNSGEVTTTTVVSGC